MSLGCCHMFACFLGSQARAWTLFRLLVKTFQVISLPPIPPCSLVSPIFLIASLASFLLSSCILSRGPMGAPGGSCLFLPSRVFSSLILPRVSFIFLSPPHTPSPCTCSPAEPIQPSHCPTCPHPHVYPLPAISLGVPFLDPLLSSLLLEFSHASFLEAPGSWHLGSGEEKAFQFYRSCMDTDAIEAVGAAPLRQVIEEVRPRTLTFLDTKHIGPMYAMYAPGCPPLFFVFFFSRKGGGRSLSLGSPSSRREMEIAKPFGRERRCGRERRIEVEPQGLQALRVVVRSSRCLRKGAAGLPGHHPILSPVSLLPSLEAGESPVIGLP